ncbi:MAG: hypothetical protein Q8N17_18765, partial [Burkholderiaceae bacterium]|nr:hypothetical protein [Burkholderiaceae bacterium]
LFFFIFLPKLYYSFRIRKLKFDFLFDKYVSNEYKINFYNFFFKEYSDKFTNIVFIFLKAVKTKSNLLVLTAFKKMKIFKFYLNLYLSDVLYFY